MATSSGKDTNYIAILRSISAGSNIGSWYETLLSPLRKAISSQLVLSAFEALRLRLQFSREEGTSNEEVFLRNGLHRYMSTWVELYRMAKKAI